MPGRFTPWNTRYQLYRRLGRPQGRSGQVRKILPPQEFDPQTVQPIASRYTDWVIPAHYSDRKENKVYFSCSKRRYIVYILYKSLPIKFACFRMLSSSAQSVSVRATYPVSGVLHFRDVCRTDYCTCSDVITPYCWKCWRHLRVLLKKIGLLRAMAPCGLEYRCGSSEGLYCFHLQGVNNSSLCPSRQVAAKSVSPCDLSFRHRASSI